MYNHVNRFTHPRHTTKQKPPNNDKRVKTLQQCVDAIGPIQFWSELTMRLKLMLKRHIAQPTILHFLSCQSGS